MSTQNEEIPLEQKSSQNLQETQQTNQDQDQHIDQNYDPNYVASLEQRIAEQQIQSRRMEALLTEIQRQREEHQQSQNVQPQRDLEEDRNRFYQDPIGTLEEQFAQRDNRILKQMEQMLRPIQEVASNFRVDNEYNQIKNRLKVDPIFGKGLQDPDVEHIVDSIIKQPGVTLSEDTVKSAISQAYGMKAMGGINFRNKNPNSQNREYPNLNPGMRIDPPTVSPSRTRINSPQEKRELTEDDRLAMKYAGLKPGNPEHEKEYWSLIGDGTMVLETHPKREQKK